MKASGSVLIVPAIAVALLGGSRLALFGATHAHAVECGSTANRAGCVGPGGAATYNKNTGQVHTAKPSTDTVAPGTKVEGGRGNSATKAVEPGCAYVNGRRVCD